MVFARIAYFCLCVYMPLCVRACVRARARARAVRMFVPVSMSISASLLFFGLCLSLPISFGCSTDMCSDNLLKQKGQICYGAMEAASAKQSLPCNINTPGLGLHAELCAVESYSVYVCSNNHSRQTLQMRLDVTEVLCSSKSQVVPHTITSELYPHVGLRADCKLLCFCVQHQSAQAETLDQIRSFQAAAAARGGVYLTPSQVDYVRMLCRVISFPIYLDESDEEDGDREGGEDWRSYVLQEHPGLS